MQIQPQDLPEEYVKPISRGQITIPIAYRKAFGIDENTWVRLEAKKDRIILKPENRPKKKKKASNESAKIIPAKVGLEEYKKILKTINGSWWTEEDEKRRLEGRKQLEKKLKKLWGE